MRIHQTSSHLTIANFKIKSARVLVLVTLLLFLELVDNCKAGGISSSHSGDG